MLNEYQMPRSFFDLGQRSLRYKKNVFLINRRGIMKQISYESLRENRNENLYK